MILVDSSVWIAHLRSAKADLNALLEDRRVLSHPFVIGELACGTLRRREEFLTLVKQLPSADVVDHEEAMLLLEAGRLAGSGLTWIDVHLLAAARIANARLWTLDARLAAAARSMRIAWD